MSNQANSRHIVLCSRLAPDRSLCSLALVLLLCGTGTIFAQAQAASAANESPALRATRDKVTQLRDAIIDRAHASGFACTLAPPKIVVEHIPSYGNYDEKANVLYTADWTLLTPEEETFFRHLAGPDATVAAAQATFEESAHKWIFSHEMGHWTQACKGIVAGPTPPYDIEYGANRRALAYWREVDPAVAKRMLAIFNSVLAHAPNPVPAGQEVETYFNANYEKLGPSPAYPWFQSRMVVTASEEEPAPSFSIALSSSR